MFGTSLIQCDSICVQSQKEEKSILIWPREFLLIATVYHAALDLIYGMYCAVRKYFYKYLINIHFEKHAFFPLAFSLFILIIVMFLSTTWKQHGPVVVMSTLKIYKWLPLEAFHFNSENWRCATASGLITWKNTERNLTPHAGDSSYCAYKTYWYTAMAISPSPNEFYRNQFCVWV